MSQVPDRGLSRQILGVAAASLLLLGGCSPSVEDSIDRLADDGADADEVLNEFLLAREQAVGPLLAAFDDPQRAGARPRFVAVLFSLMTRLDDPRLGAALSRHLTDDPDAEVRATIAERAMLYGHADLAPALLQTLHDSDARVRQLSLAALGSMASRLDSTQQARLLAVTHDLLADPDRAVQLEARSRAAATIAHWTAEATQLQLQGQVAQAESVYYHALEYAPGSKQVYYWMGWHYYENGEPKKGLRVLRQHGMLLDVPRLRRAPVIDGVLDDEAWSQAARADSFYQFFWENAAWLPAAQSSHFFVGASDEALYIGFHGDDAHPDSLVTKVAALDPAHDETTDGASENIWSDDIIEIMLDADLSRQSFVHLGINSLGVRTDEFFSPQDSSTEGRWGYVADADIAAHVGPDFWSLEIALRLDRPHLPLPQPGDLWGFNLVRNYRGQRYLQWVRTYGSGLQPANFGFLRFE